MVIADIYIVNVIKREKTKTMKTTILTITALLAASTVTAQRVMTLDQCVSDALQHNVKMKNADNDVEAARQAKKQAFTKYFPTVGAMGVGFMADNELLQMSLGEGMEMGMLKNGISGGVSAQMPLFTGGRILNSNKLAEVGVETSRLQREMAKNDVVLTAENYF